MAKLSAERGSDDWKNLRERATRLCEARGTRITDLRLAVLDAVRNAKKPIGAYELASQLPSGGTRRVAANSVYRVLDLLEALGLIWRVASNHGYVIAPDEDQNHCLFLVCDDCGSTSMSQAQDIGDRLASHAHLVGFHARRQIVEVAGQCGQCSPASSGAAH